MRRGSLMVAALVVLTTVFIVMLCLEKLVSLYFLGVEIYFKETKSVYETYSP
mgnify:CR=1 FL=1